MRGPSKAPPKYRKHRATGQAIVTIQGKDFYLGPHGTKTSKAEYDRLIGEWLANGRRLPVKKDKPVSVNRIAADYWIYCRGYYVKNGKPTDEQQGIRVSLGHIKKLYGTRPATEFGPLALEAVRDQMIKADNSRRYINQNVGRIKRMFRWAVAKQMIPVEIYQALLTVDGLKKGKCQARETAPILPIDDETVETTIKHVSKVVGDMIRFQRLTGCRPGELFILRPCDIDRSDEVWQYVPESHKTEHRGRSRVILIGPKAQAIVAPYLSKAADDVCFRTPRGKLFSRGRYQKLIAYACDKANITAWAPNRLRHSAATDIRSQFGIEASQVILGHSKADTTQIYAERDIAKAAKIMREVG